MNAVGGKFGVGGMSAKTGNDSLLSAIGICKIDANAWRFFFDSFTVVGFGQIISKYL